ncbi:oligosaccharide flippase family protein [Microbacterium excoecariae]|uniref:oligosaccharide flippase family protein n=1 Tax=Microbacterium excoecariae TaxID=2715210 RepID=UPI00140A74C5|nr:oligosaccharide flippase family protein [Microbacterium excoecariae]NHI18005.1 oligosaccharide flippase family protein [Microbacterium excoecariae]
MSPSLAQAGARGGFQTLASQALVLVVKCASIVILARLVGPVEYGIAAIATSIATFATSIVLLGFGMATVQARSVSQNAKSALFYINAFMGTLAAGALLAIAGPISKAYESPELQSLIAILAVAPFVTGILSQPRVLLVRELKTGILSLTDVVSVFVALCAAVATALAGHGLEALAVQFITQPTVQMIMVIAASRWVPTSPFGASTEVRRLARVGAEIFGMNASANLSRAALVPVLGLTVADNALGNFDRANQIANLPSSVVIDQLQRVVVPVLSRVHDQPDRYQRYSRSFNIVVGYLVAGMFMYIAAISPDATAIVLGPGWSLAGPLLGFLSIAYLFRTLAQTTRWAYIATGNTRSGLILNAWMQPAAVALTLVGIPWGALGIAIAHAIVWMMLWPISVLLLRQSTGATYESSLFPAIRGATLFAPGSICCVSLSFFTQDLSPLISILMLTLVFIAGTLVTLVASRKIRRDVREIIHIARLIRD